MSTTMREDRKTPIIDLFTGRAVSQKEADERNEVYLAAISLKEFKKAIISGFVEKAKELAKDLPTEIVEETAFEGIENLIKRGFASNSYQLRRAFNLDIERSRQVAINGTAYLIEPERAMRGNNLEMAMTTWHLYELKLEDIGNVTEREKFIKIASDALTRRLIESENVLECMKGVMAFEVPIELIKPHLLHAAEVFLSRGHVVPVRQLFDSFERHIKDGPTGGLTKEDLIPIVATHIDSLLSDGTSEAQKIAEKTLSILKYFSRKEIDAYNSAKATKT